LDCDLAEHGEAHPDVGARYASIGALYCYTDDPSTAAEYLAEAVRVEKATDTATRRISLARSLNGIATCRRALGNYRDAQEGYVEALEHLRRVMPKDVAAAVSREEEAINHAFFRTENAVVSLETEVIETSPSTVAILGEGGALNTAADILNNLGMLLKSSCQATAATRLCARAVSLGVIALGRSNPSNALRLRNLGAALLARGMLYHAVHCLADAHHDCALCYGEDHSETKSCIQWLELAKRDLRGSYREDTAEGEGIFALPEVAEWFVSLLYCGPLDSLQVHDAEVADAASDGIPWLLRDVNTPDELILQLSPVCARSKRDHYADEGPLHPLDPREGDDLLDPYHVHQTAVKGGLGGAAVWASIAVEWSDILNSGSTLPKGRDYIAEYLRQCPGYEESVQGYANIPQCILLPYSAYSGYGSSRLVSKLPDGEER